MSGQLILASGTLTRDRWHNEGLLVDKSGKNAFYKLIWSWCHIMLNNRSNILTSTIICIVKNTIHHSNVLCSQWDANEILQLGQSIFPTIVKNRKDPEIIQSRAYLITDQICQAWIGSTFILGW